MKEDVYPAEHRKWKRAETMVEQAESLSPDELADAYTELTADLALPKRISPLPASLSI